MRILTILLLLFLQGAVPATVRAQCLALADLLAIGAEPTALSAPPVVTRHLSFEWVYNGPSASSREVFWAFPTPGEGALPASRLLVRAQRPGQDVVLKTTQVACVRQLRSELKSRKLEAQPVTCPGCEAVRFKGPDFEATFYSQMKGDYPYVVVVHQGTVAIPDPAAKGQAQSQPRK